MKNRIADAFAWHLHETGMVAEVADLIYLAGTTDPEIAEGLEDGGPDTAA